jgi:hypothetical protein
MPLRFNTCPHCSNKIIFNIEIEDIDSSQYPAPVYIICHSCKKLSTFYVDSLLRVSYKELEKKAGGRKTLQTR